MQRDDDFQQRRQHLTQMSNEELKARFWALTNQVVDPLVDLAQQYTSPSVERSVLLRMGFSSVEAKAITERVLELGLLGKGAGHVVLRLAKELGQEYRRTGRELAEGQHLDRAAALFPKVPRSLKTQVGGGVSD